MQAKLLPTDDITVYYEVGTETDDIHRVLTAYKEYIEIALKQPFEPYPLPPGAEIIIKEETKAVIFII